MTDRRSKQTPINLPQLIVDSGNLVVWLDEKIDGIKIPSDFRSRVAGGCLDLTMEYQNAIVLLVSRRIYGAAAALMRPIAESYVRGVWLHKCATDADLKRFSKDKVPPFSDLIRGDYIR